MADFTGGTLYGSNTDVLFLPRSGTIADTTAPVVGTITPTSGTTLGTVSTPIAFHLYDVDPGVVSFSIWVEKTGEARPYLVHDGTAFVAPFTGGSISGTGTQADPYVISFAMTGGWFDASAFSVKVKATDSDGNVLSQTVGTWTSAANPPPAAAGPTIQNIVPASGTQLATVNTPVAFQVFDDSPSIEAVLIWVKYTNDHRRFIVYDGSAFVAPFDTYSTREVVSATTWNFSVRPLGGWPADIEDLRVVGVDGDGNTVL